MAKDFQLDLKDRRIVAELFKDGRMPITRIAKQVALKPESVTYRLKRLKEAGFLEKVLPVINPKKLGYDLHFVFIKFQNISAQREKEIIAGLTKNAYTLSVITCSGNWDILVELYAKDNEHYQDAMKSVLTNIGENLDEYQSTPVLRLHNVAHSYLYADIKQKEQKQKSQFVDAKITKKDIHILSLLEIDGRMQLSTIALKLGISADQVSYRIKNMIKSGLIEKFRPNLNVSLLGYSWYINNLTLHNTKDPRRKQLLYYLQQQKNIFFIAEYAEPNAIEFEVMARTSGEFRDIIMNIRSHFSDLIKNHESLVVYKEHKVTFLPEGVKNDF